MTDELTSEQEAAVRRLLAEARHDEPVPADVAGRLDEVLDELVANEGVDDLEVFAAGSGSVTELAGVRRRRRNAGRLLLAAAAVVIGGVVVGQTLGSTGLDAGGDSDSADEAQAEAPRDGTDRFEPESTSGGDTADGSAPGEATGPVAADSGEVLLKAIRAPLPLTSANFAADVRRELGRPGLNRRSPALADFDGLSAFASATPDFVCADGRYGEGAKLPAFYDAEEAVLVLRRPRAGFQRADLLTCGSAVELNSVELPVP